MRELEFDTSDLAWNVSSRERRIEPFADIAYLVTDSVVVVAPWKARVLGDVQTISEGQLFQERR